MSTCNKGDLNLKVTYPNERTGIGRVMIFVKPQDPTL